MFLFTTSYWIIPASLQSPQPADEEMAAQRGSVVPTVSQFVSQRDQTWGLTSVLKVLCTLVFLLLSSTFQPSWYPGFMAALCLCRSLTQQRQEAVGKVVSPWRILETYPYNRYHPMGEVRHYHMVGVLVVVTTALLWARDSSLLISTDQEGPEWEAEICLVHWVKGFT